MAERTTGTGAHIGGKVKKIRIPGAKKIARIELPAFTRQLAAMLSSGMPVVQTLSALEEQIENTNFKTVIGGVRVQIEGGSSFTDALRKYPDIFDDLYVSLMQAGEMGGLMAETTARIAAFLEARERLRRKVKSAMTYPVIVLTIVFGITAGLIIFVVPKFAAIFSDFGAKLPGPTQFLVDLSEGVRKYALFVVLGIVAFVIAFGKFKRTPKGAYMLDALNLKLPVFGELTTKVALARFASTFAQLIRSGVPILQSLDIVAFATGNKVLGETIMKGRDSVERGEPLSNALSADPKFPRMLVHMLSAGEKTGRMEDMLQKIAEFYDEEVEAMLDGMTALIEPLMIVVMGVVVGGIVLCLFLPIFKMSEIVSM
ncbi:MAG TPA: type II secretion system F family protein [Kiritimatiellia bacterium]|nr:type II secretion system F family protein [Kiritimatiellia bacterium]HNS80131.1 type II secretion system F family protein [Kiritimatiellia bacterium]HPA77558.1 type II secretion system F family protein [Kiritimatiellia bacterium]HQQ04194.1 type II secretion system F family protein [Kiritimatiellia bacterium]